MTDVEQQLILFSVFIENTYFFIDKEDLAYYFDKYYKYWFSIDDVLIAVRCGATMLKTWQPIAQWELDIQKVCLTHAGVWAM